MSKNPKIKHDRDKDKMRITIRGYSLSKITRGEIIENLILLVESSPDRIHAEARKSKGKVGKKSDRNPPKKVSRLVYGGD